MSGGASLTLGYDPLGRLRQTTAGAVTTDFLYEGDRLIAEYNGATVLRRYAHGPGVDEPIVWYEGSNLATKRWLHPDERGSIVAWSNASAGATVYRYGAYGEPEGADYSGSRFRYTGQIALPEVKLYHYKARVYDPVLGRFLQTDPVGYQDDFNLYSYAASDPINLFDPRGQAVEVIRNGNSVTLNFYVKFVGSKTPANIRHISRAAEKVWRGTFGNYQVTANVLVPTKNTPQELINVIVIRQNSSQGEIRHDMRSGFIGAKMSERGVAHEFGHLAYLADPRHANPKSVPSSDPDIMDKEDAPIRGTTIERILQEASARGTLTTGSSGNDDNTEQKSNQSEWSQFDGMIIGNACTSIQLGCW